MWLVLLGDEERVDTGSCGIDAHTTSVYSRRCVSNVPKGVVLFQVPLNVLEFRSALVRPNFAFFFPVLIIIFDMLQ